MAKTNPTQWSADLSATAADMVAVLHNAQSLLNRYNDTGLAAVVDALEADAAVADMGGLVKEDVVNMINTLNNYITDMEAGHRTNCNKVTATIPPAS